jgi:predicted Zn finger-like uncharacterized protein
MKYFKCGNCQSPYKIDETQIRTTQIQIVCPKCSTKNLLHFGPVLVFQSRDKISKVNLKEGEQIIGRKTSKSNGAHILVEDEFVSREHVCISIQKKEGKIYFYIQDMGSSNGTFNKHKQRLKTGLRYAFLPDDYFVIGLTKISLQNVSL